jgi:hypothetical protein
VQLPSCAATVEAGEIKKMIENGAFSKLINIQVFSVTDGKDNGMMGEKRRCSAMVWSNMGKEPFDFTIERMPNDGIWIATDSDF